MENTNQYNIVLPKGAAKRPFYELTDAEILEVGKAIFQKVSELAAQVGSLPVTTENLHKIHPKD